MTITKTCNTCEHYPNDHHCVGCEWDKSKGENTKWELKKNPIVIERAVLDKIRAEIEALPRELPTDARNMVRRTRVLDIIDRYKGE